MNITALAEELATAAEQYAPSTLQTQFLRILNIYFNGTDTATSPVPPTLNGRLSAKIAAIRVAPDALYKLQLKRDLVLSIEPLTGAQLDIASGTLGVLPRRMGQPDETFLPIVIKAAEAL